MLFTIHCRSKYLYNVWPYQRHRNTVRIFNNAVELCFYIDRIDKAFWNNFKVCENILYISCSKFISHILVCLNKKKKINRNLYNAYFILEIIQKYKNWIYLNYCCFISKILLENSKYRLNTRKYINN